jgi:hypothetical protein
MRLTIVERREDHCRVKNNASNLGIGSPTDFQKWKLWDQSGENEEDSEVIVPESHEFVQSLGWVSLTDR